MKIPSALLIFPRIVSGLELAPGHPVCVRSRLPWRHRASPSATLYEAVISTDTDRLIHCRTPVNIFCNYELSGKLRSSGHYRLAAVDLAWLCSGKQLAALHLPLPRDGVFVVALARSGPRSRMRFPGNLGRERDESRRYKCPSRSARAGNRYQWTVSVDAEPDVPVVESAPSCVRFHT